MGKTEMQNSINNYLSRINDNYSEVSELEKKISNIEKEIGTHNVAIGCVSSFFVKKRNTINKIDSLDMSRSSVSFIEASLDVYGNGTENTIISKENNIIGYLQNNIDKLYERIKELEYENYNLENMITSCNDQIAEIEKEEAESDTKKNNSNSSGESKWKI